MSQPASPSLVASGSPNGSPTTATASASKSPFGKASPGLQSIPEGRHHSHPGKADEHLNPAESVTTGLSNAISAGLAKLSFTSPQKSDAMKAADRPVLSRNRKSRSPPPALRFQRHVSFDNFSGVEPIDDKNTLSFTLNVRHKGYQYKRRSRTFMVGVDENTYSDYAVQWMLDELVDDGDQIVCLRVIEGGSKISSDRALEAKQYQEEAFALMEGIQKKNDDNRAISIVLEFAVGKLQTTFQKMIKLYEPGMLIVGTKGRSLGGIQGLMSNRNSFSKWCLQYSPIPVVVVRPTAKREKKKMKRSTDPSRQEYIHILQESGASEHEANSIANRNMEAFETLLANNPDAEAHEVAAALGLPAKFDPTIKPLDLTSSHGHPLRKVVSGRSDATSESPGDSRSASPVIMRKGPRSPGIDSPALSGAEDESDDEEGEFEAVSGHALLGNQPNYEEKEAEKEAEVKAEKLHQMEVGEAAALAAGRKMSVASVETVDSSTSGGGDSGGGVPLETNAEK